MTETRKTPALENGDSPVQDVEMPIGDDPREHWIVYTDADGKRVRVTMTEYESRVSNASSD